MAEALPSQRKLSERTFVDEFLTCHLCVEEFNGSTRRAKVLPCNHTICEPCLQNLTRTDNNSDIRCPYCNREWALPNEGFPTHYMLGGLREYRSVIRTRSSPGESVFALEDTNQVHICSCCPTPEEAGEAVAHCADCGGYVCQTCIDHHDLLKPLKGHLITQLSDVTRPSVERRRCHLHQEQELTVYCKTCNQAVCNTCCALTDHEGHLRYDLKLALEEAKRDLCALADKARVKLEPVLNLSTSIDAVINDMNIVCVRREQEIQDLFEEIGKAVQEQCESAKETLRKMCQKKTKRLQKQKTEVESVCTEFESACEFAENTCQITDPEQLLLSQKQISSRLNDLIDADHDTPELVEPLENTFIRFQDNHTSSIAEVRRLIEYIGVVQSTSTLPSLCHVTSLPFEFSSTASIQPGDTELALVRTEQLNSDEENEKPSGSGGDPITAHLIAPDGTRQPCTVTDHNDGSYAVAYTPENFGNYMLDIRLFDRPIHGSPYALTVEQNAREEHKPASDGVSWLPAVAGFPHYIRVTLPDVDSACSGEPYVKARAVKADIKDAIHGQNIACTIRKQTDDPNTHVIQYTPPLAEELRVNVEVNSKCLPNSPYVIDVADLSKERTEISFGTPIANQKWMISVVPKNSVGRPLSISHSVVRLRVTTLKQSKDLKILAHHVTSEHVHVFQCIPHKVGIYQVDAVVHGISIKGKPLPVNVEMSLTLPTPGDRDSCPTSVTTSPSGVTFLSNTKSGMIHVHNPTDSYSNIAVNLKRSSQIAIDHQGNLFLLETERKRVHMYNVHGEMIANWKCARDNNKPVTITCIRHFRDAIVITGDASPDYNGLFFYRANGTPVKCISLASAYFIEGHDSICVDDRNHIFVCHSARTKVVEFSYDGGFIREFSTEVRGPQLSISSTPDGFILIAARGRICIMDLRTGFAKYRGGIEAHGDSYNSMAATNDGCVVALDVTNKRLVKYGYLTT